MANTYTQLLIQLVFSVQGRKNLIPKNHRESLEKYICGIITHQKSKPLAIYCNPDHCHVLFGLNPNISISDMARLIKSNSSKWINDNKMLSQKFSWQEGYGAFSYSKSHLNRVAMYILNQAEHHKKQQFKEEYINLLQKFEIQFEENYLFDWIE